MLYHPQHLTITLLMAHLKQLLLPGTSCLATKKKNYKAYQKAKKHIYNLKQQSIRTRHSRNVEIIGQII